MRKWKTEAADERRSPILEQNGETTVTGGRTMRWPGLYAGCVLLAVIISPVRAEEVAGKATAIFAVV